MRPRPSQWRGQLMATSDPGELIYQKRRIRGWSKARLCDEIQSWEYRHGNGDVLGLNPNYVREWETGKRSVSDHYAPKLAAVLDIPIEAFVDRRTRRSRSTAPGPGPMRPASPAIDGVDHTVAAPLAVALEIRDRLLRQWATSPCSARWGSGCSPRSSNPKGA